MATPANHSDPLQAAKPPEAPRPVASVVIPTRDRAALLERCLASLLESPGEEPFEVLVVDNGSTDSTPELIRRTVRRWPQVRSVLEPRRGSAYALNAGAEAARAPVLVFVDDDMVAAPGLVAFHLGAHRQHPGSCILGQILSAPSRRPFDRMLAYIFDGLRTTLTEREPTFMDYWSGNVSLSRETYFRFGGYSEVFGRIGYGKDVDFGRRLVLGGVPLRFVPEAATTHHFSESFADRLGKAHRIGLACSYIKENHPDCPVDDRLLVRGSWWSGPLVWLCRLVAACLEPFDRGPGVPITPLAFVYDLGLRTATARGVSAFHARPRSPEGPA